MKTISIQRSPIGARQSSPAMNAAKTAAAGYWSNRQNNTIIIDKEWYTLMLKSKFITALSTACAVLSMTAPVTFAADGDGVQDNYQEYKYNAETSKWEWGDATTKSTVKDDKQHDGSIHIEYDTNGGWKDPGKDPSDPNDNHTHLAGTFVVTIPTLIKHTGLMAGKVDITDTFTVNVRGSIPGDKAVHLKVDPDAKITNKAGTDSLTVTTTQGKTDWSSDETYGSLAADGVALLGKDETKNTIRLLGEAKTSGTYTGTVTYTATLVDDPSVKAKTSGTNAGGTDNGLTMQPQLKNNRKQIRPTAGFVVQKGQSQWTKLILAK